VIEFALAAGLMLLAIIPLGYVAWRRTVMDAVVAYEAATSVVVMIFILLAEAFQRPGEFEFPILLAVLMLGSGLVFLHALERWL
jgi:multisubunit Na+/H+ antiporter MnhF subunit